jgi:predicted transcriptional regulator
MPLHNPVKEGGIISKTPCEIVIWKILPTIRSELARNLVQEYGLSQRESAKRLGLTDAAVSQYLSQKRGTTKVTDEKLKKEIREAARRIATEETEHVVAELCLICHYFKDLRLLGKMYKSETGEVLPDCLICAHD